MSGGPGPEVRPGYTIWHKKEGTEGKHKLRGTGQPGTRRHNGLRPAGQQKAENKKQRRDTQVPLRSAVSCYHFPWLPVFKSRRIHLLCGDYEEVPQFPHLQNGETIFVIGLWMCDMCVINKYVKRNNKHPRHAIIINVFFFKCLISSQSHRLLCT